MRENFYQSFESRGPESGLGASGEQAVELQKHETRGLEPRTDNLPGRRDSMRIAAAG